MSADYTRMLNDVFDTIITRLRAVESRQRAAQSYSNLAVNGGFEIWSGGSGPFTVNGAINDAWNMDVMAASLSVSKDTTNEDFQYSASCAVCVAGGASRIYHTITAPYGQPASQIAISARVRASVPNAVRLDFNGLYSQYHTGSGLYETLIAVGVPIVGGPTFDLSVLFDLACTAYVDNVMAVQGTAPIDYIVQTLEDESARIAAYNTY